MRGFSLFHYFDDFFAFVQVSRKVPIENTLGRIVIQHNLVLHLQKLVCLNALASFVNSDFMHFLGVHLVSELLELLFSLSTGSLFLFLLLNVELILVLQI